MTHLAHQAFEFHGITLHWYGLAYLFSFLWISWQSKRLLRRNGVWGSHAAPILPHSVALLVATLALGVVGGARLGFVLEAIGNGASAATAVKLGGMSSFGAFAGALLALAAFCAFTRADLRSTLDLVAFAAPGCIFLIRIANFVNGDFVGVPVESTWASTLLGGTHPVALYEAIGEGLIPLMLLRLCVARRAWLSRPGAITGLFALLYAVVRGAAIGFREVQPGFVHSSKEVDALCCFGLAIIGSILIVVASKSRPLKTPRATEATPTCNGSRLADLAYAAVVMSVSLPLGGCSGGSRSQVPNIGPADQVTIIYTNPGAEAQCPCGNSAGAYAQNQSDTTRAVSWTVYAKDTISGNTIPPPRARRRLALVARSNSWGAPSMHRLISAGIKQPTS